MLRIFVSVLRPAVILQLTPRNVVLFGRLGVTQLVKEFPGFILRLQGPATSPYPDPD
jgi:hypothetical protein